MRSKGYSLLELMVVVSLLGIVFGAGFVSFREFTRRQEVANAEEKVIGDLRLAQSRASAGSKTTGCLGTFEGYEFYVTDTGPPAAYVIRAVCETQSEDFKTVQLDGQIRFERNPSPNPILFLALAGGTNIGNSTSLTILNELSFWSRGTRDRAERVINITSTGEIR